MNQIIVISTLKILHNATTLFFGIFVSAFFLGVRKTRKNIVTLLLFCACSFIFKQFSSDRRKCHYTDLSITDPYTSDHLSDTLL